MKVKNLLAEEVAEMLDTSKGDEMSALSQDGWIEFELMVAIDRYLSTQDFTNAYAFAKDIERKAYKVWQEVQIDIDKKNATEDEVPF